MESQASEATMWEVAFFLSAALLIVGVVIAFIINRRPYRHSFIRPLPVLLATVFLVMVVLFFPPFVYRIGAETGGTFESFLLALQTAFKVFKIDNVYDLFVGPLRTIDSWVTHPYTIFATLLCMIAPFLLLGFALSFIRSVSAYCTYFFSYLREVYIFSKLNDKSLALAKSVLCHYEKNGKSKARIIFAGVAFEGSSSSNGLYESARDIKCVCFKQDILSIRLDIHSKFARMNFIIMGDQKENNTQALRLLEQPPRGEKPDYSTRKPENTWLYVIDSSKGTKVLLDGNKRGAGAMTIRRIDHARQFIHYLIWKEFWNEETKEHALFSSPFTYKDTRYISVLLVGLGKNGTAMLKALAWFGQMDGHHLEIHALDIDPKAEERLSFLCPDLLDEKYNHKNDLNEAMYSITIHPGIDTNSSSFTNVVKELAGKTTLAFVSLGNGEENIGTAMNLRVLFERYGDPANNRPPIYAVLHDTEKIAMLNRNADFSEDHYHINLIGDNQDLYSYQMIFDPRLEQEALDYHLFWAVKSSGDATEAEIREKSEEFWGEEYYRNSSISRVIHNKAVRKYGPLSNENKAARSEEQTALIAGMLEHRRWNAYMRSEGFVYNSVRNNLAKQHNLLIRYDELSVAEQEKDFKNDSP